MSTVLSRAIQEDAVPLSPGACGRCQVGESRRDFLRDMLAVGAMALASLGAPAEAAAGTPDWLAASTRVGAVVRYPVPAADGVQIDRANQVILVRWEHAAYAFALSCPHQNTALRWVARDTRFQCPKHNSRYTPDGSFISGRATRGMDRYDIARDGGELEVQLDNLRQQDRDREAWDAAYVQLD